MFTLDTETGFRDVVLINASYGLGEPIVQGSVTPDEYFVFKPTLKQGFAPILQKSRRHAKSSSSCTTRAAAEGLRRCRLRLAIARAARSTDEEILTLARWACAIEEHYSRTRGMPTPMDIEWAKDGRTGELFILQARPETVHAQQHGRTRSSSIGFANAARSSPPAAASAARSPRDPSASYPTPPTCASFNKARCW